MGTRSSSRAATHPRRRRILRHAGFRREGRDHDRQHPAAGIRQRPRDGRTTRSFRTPVEAASGIIGAVSVSRLRSRAQGSLVRISTWGVLPRLLLQTVPRGIPTLLRSGRLARCPAKAERGTTSCVWSWPSRWAPSDQGCGRTASTNTPVRWSTSSGRRFFQTTSRRLLKECRGIDGIYAGACRDAKRSKDRGDDLEETASELLQPAPRPARPTRTHPPLRPGRADFVLCRYKFSTARSGGISVPQLPKRGNAWPPIAPLFRRVRPRMAMQLGPTQNHPPRATFPYLSLTRQTQGA